MTKLDRPVVRETAVVSAEKPVIITLEGGGKMMSFRLKGTKKEYKIRIDDVFTFAALGSIEEK